MDQPNVVRSRLSRRRSVGREVNSSVDLGGPVLGAGEADLSPSNSPSQPSRSASATRASRSSRISTSRDRWSGSGQSIEQRTQACSWIHGVEKARAQVPMETLRRSKWPRNSCHSSSVGTQYSSLGRRPDWFTEWQEKCCEQPHVRRSDPSGRRPRSDDAQDLVPLFDGAAA